MPIWVAVNANEHTALSEPVDVYHEWIDKCEEVNYGDKKRVKRSSLSDDEEGGQTVAGLSASDEDDDWTCTFCSI